MAENDEPQIYKKRYKIEKKLGAGNFGTAYLVTDLKLKREPKVLKVVRLGEMDSDQTVDSVREAELLSNLDNEYIVKFYESFLENDCLCIVTEYCEGGDLDQRLKECKKQNRTLEEDQIVEWLIEILLAVQYIHKSRILHRDLKARNIFLKGNQIKIGDFGISRILVGTMDVATTFTGTPYYMSPEVMKHDGYEAKSDIWSVGCLLYEMCTYQHAFDGKGLMNVIYKVVEGRAPELPKAYSKELNDVLKKIFLKDPKNRPTATQLLQAPFILRHRERTKLTGPLETTIAGKNRSREINSRFQNAANYGDMKSNSWSISGKDHVNYNDDEIEDGNHRGNEEPEDEAEEEEYTVKPANTFKSAHQAMIERKMQAADTRGQMFSQTIRSNAVESAQNRQMSRDVDEMNPSNRRVAVNPSSQSGGFEDRPITPMRATFTQVAERFGEGGESSSYDRSSARESNTRLMSASQRATMNSMSRTIDPRYASKYHEPAIPMSPSITIGAAPRRRASSNVSIDDNSATLKDNPKRDAYGPLAKELKIQSLRADAIRLLGESTFEKVYDYLVKQRTAQKTDPNIDDAKIGQGLSAFVKKTSDCFLVDQLVFFELT